MVKYAVFPGVVVSRADRDLHHITAKQLMDLYKVKPNECVVINPGLMSDGEYRARLEQARGLVQLHPRSDGNYTLPTEPLFGSPTNPQP